LRCHDGEWSREEWAVDGFGGSSGDINPHDFLTMIDTRGALRQDTCVRYPDEFSLCRKTPCPDDSSMRISSDFKVRIRGIHVGVDQSSKREDDKNRATNDDESGVTSLPRRGYLEIMANQVVGHVKFPSGTTTPTAIIEYSLSHSRDIRER
jgi:hypothetical protein